MVALKFYEETTSFAWVCLVWSKRDGWLAPAGAFREAEDG